MPNPLVIPPDLFHPFALLQLKAFDLSKVVQSFCQYMPTLPRSELLTAFSLFAGSRIISEVLAPSSLPGSSKGICS